MRWIGTLAAFVLGGVLLFATYAKVLDPKAFAAEIERQGLTFGLAPMTLAIAALALEAGLGLLLLLDVRRVPVLVASGLLVLFFLGLTGRTYWRAAHGQVDAGEACGCFGNLVERTPAEAFWQDLALLAPSAALAWLGRPGARRGLRMRTATASLAAAGVAVFAWQAPRLPLDDLATRLKPGVRVAEICAGSGEKRVCLDGLAPGLAAGDHWVVIADVAAPGFAEVASWANARAVAGSEPSAAVLASFTPEQAHQLFWTYAPAFDLHEVPSALLRPLYRELPRSFRATDGVVVQTVSGLPSNGASAAPAS